MLYVAMLTWKDHLTREQQQAALVRRAAWELPERMDLHGEYWIAGAGPHVVSVFEADDYETIMELVFTWNDTFHIEVAPATTPEEGLKIGPGVLERVNATT